MAERIYDAIKYAFSPDEIRELGVKLAAECELYATLEREKAQAAAAVGARMKEALARVAELTTKINNGYEARNVECIVIMENPRPGLKTLVRVDTNETVRTEPMTLAEMQQSFGFSEGEPE